MKKALDVHYWDSVAEDMQEYHLDRDIAIYKRYEHIKIIKEWGSGLKGKRILKTDLFEEAFGDDHFLFWLLGESRDTFGMDISHKIASRAKSRSEGFNTEFKNCIASDIRNSAFKDESFDLIISNSTLDNLASCDVQKALSELRRILKPEGIFILTLDNAHNPLYVLSYCIEKLLNTNKYYQSKCYSVKEAVRLAKQNNFIVQDITAIMHIPTPFNKLAILLKKMDSIFMENIVRCLIALFSKFGNRKTKFLTGWFIALKLVKNDK